MLIILGVVFLNHHYQPCLPLGGYTEIIGVNKVIDFIEDITLCFDSTLQETESSIVISGVERFLIQLRHLRMPLLSSLFPPLF
jgi:hypothetical protein